MTLRMTAQNPSRRLLSASRAKLAALGSASDGYRTLAFFDLDDGITLHLTITRGHKARLTGTA